jgi:hypothetical protein
MSQKRMPSDHEIASLADRFRELWKPGEEMRPWLREQSELLLQLVHGKWSWASMARVLTTAGITYRTGKPWSAGLLRKDFSRAQSPLKGYARRQKVEPPPEIAVPVPAASFPQPDLQPITTGEISVAVVPQPSRGRAPNSRFKPAVAKPYAPPIQLTNEERTEIDDNRKRVLGY